MNSRFDSRSARSAAARSASLSVTGVDRLQVQRDADLVALGVSRGRSALHRQAVAEQQVVGGGEGAVRLLRARRVPAAGVAQDRASSTARSA